MSDRLDPKEFLNRPLVYVAAPYTRPDPVENTHLLIAQVDQIAEEGIVTPIAPHLTLLWHLVRPRTIDFWYAYDLATVARCDALLRLPGDSTGADNEVNFAEERGIPVFRDKADLYQWAQSL